jgi:catechol 2,3-dioxygenase-like lactoylglutathione lyase family enzyme
MKIQSLGHAVIKVRDLERSVQFYRDILGMQEAARHRGVIAFFSLGHNHHDLGLLQVGTDAPAAARAASASTTLRPRSATRRTNCAHANSIWSSMA